MYIKLNARGCKVYSWLIGTKLLVYGYNPNTYSFIIWDDIMSQWIHIAENQCEGVD